MPIIDELLRKATERMAGQSLPESTYRLQFHAGFKFRDAEAIVPYLHDLGISHIYASPYLKARPGSLHGYDITDHRSLNPEIGSTVDYDALVTALHANGMGQILDMVPNHMGIVGNANAWWNDVLENGRASPYAGYFDIAWQDAPRTELNNRVLLPVLGEPYGQALEGQRIRLAYEDGVFAIYYFDQRFPVTPHSYATLLNQDIADLQRELGAEAAPLVEFQSILTAVSHLPGPGEPDPVKVAELLREKEVVKRRLATLAQECPAVRASLEKTVALYNGKEGDPRSFDLLDRLLDQQVYRLSFWRVAADEINYRRFFDVNDLAALSMEKLDVFTASHDLVLRLLSQGKINGLRIDHPDGLYDPNQYLLRLQQYYLLAHARAIFDADAQYQDTKWKDVEGPLLEQIGAATPDRSLYVVVEKILGPAEDLQGDWETHGTSGYDFLTAINGLFVDPLGAEPLTQFYRALTGEDCRFADLVFAKKSLVLRDTLSSELHMLGRQLDRLAQKNRRSRDFTANSLRFALREVIAFFAVYRSYISEEGVHPTDRRYVEMAVARAMRRNATVSGALFRFVRDMLLLIYPESANEDDRAEQRRFAGKFQQVTAPIMAKGVEDTSFYIYNRLLSLNEVGGDPSRFGMLPDAVHRYLGDRQARWPHALSPLSTHDTKRSEDVRARLNVLSELAGEWQECVTRWRRLNEPHRTNVDDALAPDANEEYLIYQTLLGAWLPGPSDAAERTNFVERIQAYLMKALHEAKVRTSWINPNEAYDDGVRQFIARILDDQTGADFLGELRTFQGRISHFGLLNSLSQTLLKIVSPGAPDTYQGTELWDFSLVDPDNRRPVDYARRRAALSELDRAIADAGTDRRTLAQDLIHTREDGRVKLFVTALALRCRHAHPGLFSIGEYLPAAIDGAMKEHAFGFARRHNGDIALAIVPRLATRLGANPPALPLGESVWKDTRVSLPEMPAGLAWHNVFTGQVPSPIHEANQAAFSLAEVFADFPVALLVTREKERLP